MAFESSQSEEMQRPKKIGSISTTAEYRGYLEGFLAMPKGQTTFSAPIINYCSGLRKGLEILTSFALTNNYYCSLKKRLERQTFSVPSNYHCRGLKERLETQLMSTTSTLFISSSDIPEDISSSIEPLKTSYNF